ncbi:MAG: glycerol-3-phosphate dehydrogenase/oxidase [Chloroflexota bacterium]|nr:MAG: glycerol-3-phosphate dehydrogenase/oxidase [Chloroflexota bacterium]
MKRDLAGMSREEYDLLVIGGGIYGACVAWDAALRGLSVALVEKGDFGGATSANSLKIIHGGLRYLRNGSLRLMRTMVRERSIWMRIAPHLAHPLPFLMPTNRHLASGRLALSVALTINDIVSYDRNTNDDPQKRLPNGRTISKQASLRALPGLRPDDVTGGAIWYDAQIFNSERLLISIVESAVNSGASAANYAEAITFLLAGAEVKGVRARDVMDGQEFEIQAKVTVNCAGAWADTVLGFLGNRSPEPTSHLSVALNLVTRQIRPDVAMGVYGHRPVAGGFDGESQQSQVLFIVPWRQYSLIGTTHAHFTGPPQSFEVTEATVQDLIDRVNAAYPGAALMRDDVYHVHQGYLPAVEIGAADDEVKLLREGRVHDHAQKDGIDGLITVVGVKYTTARHVAQEVVDRAAAKLAQKTRPCRTHLTPIIGGQVERFDEFLSDVIAQYSELLGPEVSEHLAYTYGSNYHQVLNYLDDDPSLGQTICEVFPVIKAEVIHAIRQEMALTLADVVLRRTELGAAGLPEEECIAVCADLMTAELGWNHDRRQKEIEGVYTAYGRLKMAAGAIE